MARYIDTDKLVGKYVEIKVKHGFRIDEKISGNDIAMFLGEALDELQEEDVAPVKHGKWIEPYYPIERTPTKRYSCSICGRSTGRKQTRSWIYCPTCGAKMDG